MMSRRVSGAAVVAACLGVPAIAASNASAASVFVIGGQTSVALDFETLSSVGLEFSGISPDVIVPGSLDGSVAFGINARDAASPLRPTTFTYDPADFLGSFAGSIEHAGSVFFNDGALEVGNFSIGFDASRATGDAIGFFVESTVGLSAILFDIAAPSQLSATSTDLTIGAALLVSPELAGVLGNEQLTGATVGQARVEAVAIPTPSAVLAGLMGVALVLRRGRAAPVLVRS
jgi:hypothetical protein